MAQERHTAAFVVGVVLGGLAAAGATLWKVPRSGASTRALIAEQAEGILFRLTGMDEWQSSEAGARSPVATTAAGSGSEAPRPQPPLPTPVLTPETVGGVVTLPDPLEPPPIEAAVEEASLAVHDEPALPPTFRGEVVTEKPTDVVLDGPRPAPTDH